MTSRHIERTPNNPHAADLDEPSLDGENGSGIQDSSIDEHSTPDTTPEVHPQSPPRTHPSKHRRKTSQDTSRASSDLELEEMGREDPLYHANGRISEERMKLDPNSARRSWADTLFDPAEVDRSDHDREARRMGSREFLHKTLINGILIALWYILSIAMSVYNKWMFSPGNLDFHYPLFTTSAHMIVQFSLASLVLLVFPSFRPSHGSVANPHDSEESPEPAPEPVDRSKPIMTPWFYLTRIVTTGIVTGLDIGLGNTSLKFISLTFFTMCKSSTLGFVLLFAILFRLESPSWKIFSIIAVMTIGVIMMVAGETAFDGLGFTLLMLASFFSGLRWSLTQMLLRRTPATSNPFSTLFFLTPIMFLILFLLAIPSEGFRPLATGLSALATTRGLPLGTAILLFPGILAFCMTSAEFALLKRTSVVTLSVCGIFKEVLTITAAGLIFGDELTPINISGLMVTIAAIAVYNVTRMRRMRRQEIGRAQERLDLDLDGRGEAEAMLAGRVNGGSWEGEVLDAEEGEHTQHAPRGSAERATGLLPGLPAALVKRRGEYEEVGQGGRDG